MFSLHNVLIHCINKIRYFLNLVLYIVQKKHTHYFYLIQICYNCRVCTKNLGRTSLLHFRDGLGLQALPNGAFLQQRGRVECSVVRLRNKTLSHFIKYSII